MLKQNKHYGTTASDANEVLEVYVGVNGDVNNFRFIDAKVCHTKAQDKIYLYKFQSKRLETLIFLDAKAQRYEFHNGYFIYSTTK